MHDKEPTKKQLLWEIKQLLQKLVNKNKPTNSSNDTIKILEDRINLLEQKVAYLEATKFQPLIPRQPYPIDVWYVNQTPAPVPYYQWQVVGKSDDSKTSLDGYVDQNGNVTKPNLAKEFKEK